jgi:hypothetical protein
MNEIPTDCIEYIADKLDNKELINLASINKNIRKSLHTKIKICRELHFAIEIGARYNIINSICDSYLGKDCIELFQLLSNHKYHKDMILWYSLIDIGDILYTKIHWVDKNLNPYGPLEIIKKDIPIHNTYHDMYFYTLHFKGELRFESIKTPAYIFIPPRIDLI